MLLEKQNPVAGDDRASEITNVLGGAFDGWEDTFSSFESPAFPVAVIAARHRLTLPRARLVCELAAVGRAFV